MCRNPPCGLIAALAIVFVAAWCFLLDGLLARGMFRVFWAAWLAIGETAFFVPIEVYDLMHDFSVAVFIILLVNMAIVWYLVKNRDRLFHHFAPSSTPSSVPESVEPSA